MNAEERGLATHIADELRQLILSGTHPPDAPLPSESTLQTRYSAGRGSVRRAMAILINEGLVVSRPREGYYVRQYERLQWWPGVFEHLTTRLDVATAGADAWASDVKAQNRDPEQRIEVTIIPAPPRVAERLALEPGQAVVSRRRLRYVDGVPYQTADSYYPLDVAEGSPIMTPGDVTIPGGLMAAAGHRQTRFRDELIGRDPSREEGFRLNLPAATRVIEHTRTGFNAAGRPVRVIITIVPGDRHVIIYEVLAE